MDSKENYITKEKKILLEKELEDLKGPKRKKIIDTLAYAKSLGDLSENAEYHQAREEQGGLEYKIKQIEHLLKVAKVVKKTGGDIVSIGSVVVLSKEGSKNKITYTIVGNEESDEGKISNHSPLGTALFGKKKGDQVEFETPMGIVNYKIIKVS